MTTAASARFKGGSVGTAIAEKSDTVNQTVNATARFHYTGFKIPAVEIKYNQETIVTRRSSTSDRTTLRSLQSEVSTKLSYIFLLVITTHPVSVSGFRASCDAAACQGLMDVSILTATPIVLGVLTCTEEQQAIKRSTGDNNHGLDWGKRSSYRSMGNRPSDAAGGNICTIN